MREHKELRRSADVTAVSGQGELIIRVHNECPDQEVIVFSKEQTELILSMLLENKNPTECNSSNILKQFPALTPYRNEVYALLNRILEVGGSALEVKSFIEAFEGLVDEIHCSRLIVEDEKFWENPVTTPLCITHRYTSNSDVLRTVSALTGEVKYFYLNAIKFWCKGIKGGINKVIYTPNAERVSSCVEIPHVPFMVRQFEVEVSRGLQNFCLSDSNAYSEALRFYAPHKEDRCPRY